MFVQAVLWTGIGTLRSLTSGEWIQHRLKRLRHQRSAIEQARPSELRGATKASMLRALDHAIACHGGESARAWPWYAKANVFEPDEAKWLRAYLRNRAIRDL
eukprot:TRINITY_DN24247_c0_g1_i2.p3 TRINITY_DN24247_c0_g1~~TRINITY_DN24247_c0_g1_i2.p3  ORF type:complete len:102 (-),score=16.95 TRINITY_DN24247_c0_g1_i2:169-474(-)